MIKNNSVIKLLHDYIDRLSNYSIIGIFIISTDKAKNRNKKIIISEDYRLRAKPSRHAIKHAQEALTSAGDSDK